jgi:hypothetical protein
MLRAAEIGLFLLPFGLFLLWRLMAPHVRPVLLWFALVSVLLLAGVAIGYGLHDRMNPHERYIPAHMENGRIIDGTGMPLKQ